MNGHNTEFRNPYNYPLKKLLFVANTVSAINDKTRALQANIDLTTGVASNGFGGKEASKAFNSMIKRLNGET